MRVATGVALVVLALGGSLSWAAPASGVSGGGFGGVGGSDGPRSIVVALRSDFVAVPVEDGVRVRARAGDGGDGADTDALASVAALMESGAFARVRMLRGGVFGDPQVAARAGLDRILLVTPWAGADDAALLARLRALGPVVASAQPDVAGRVTGPDAFAERRAKDDGLSDPARSSLFRTSDEWFSVQYGLLNLGQAIDGQDGVDGASPDVASAWTLTVGTPETLIAVIDAGVSPRHPDLADKLVPGRAFIGDPEVTDDGASSHGTHVAGIAAASSNNGFGVAGVDWRARVLPVRVTTETGFTNATIVAEGLTWAVDQGADVASLSLGFGSGNAALEAAVEYAALMGVVTVASVGNLPGGTVLYPAAYEQTIAVGATDNQDVLWQNSTRGPEVDVVAPGVNIMSTWDTPDQPETYRLSTGTSQAVPLVAGVASLMLSVNPGLSPEDVRRIIERTALDLGEPGRDDLYGAGRIDAYGAVLEALRLVDCVADFDGDGRLTGFDLLLYLQAFRDQDPRADLAEPFGVFNYFDVTAYLGLFDAGCV